MKRISIKLMAVLAVLMFGAFFSVNEVVAEENKAPAMSISISPVSKVLQLSENTTYEDKFKISNNGASAMKFEVYAAPYSYSYSETTDSYQLGFNNQNTYTQITRWITFKDTSGNWVEKATFTAEPGTQVEVSYKISTPASIPAGGQYAVLFAHTISDNAGGSGIKTEASPGLVVFGRADGETILSGESSDLKISDLLKVDNEEKRIINGSAKVKNTGNVDFIAAGTLKVTGIFGNVYYETPANSTRSKASVIPEAELEISDSWDNTSYFGLFNVSWTVTYGNGQSETISQIILIMPLPIIILMISLLTIITIWIIISIRKRKERRSRFMM